MHTCRMSSETIDTVGDLERCVCPNSCTTTLRTNIRYVVLGDTVLVIPNTLWKMIMLSQGQNPCQGLGLHDTPPSAPCTFHGNEVLGIRSMHLVQIIAVFSCPCVITGGPLIPDHHFPNFDTFRNLIPWTMLYTLRKINAAQQLTLPPRNAPVPEIIFHYWFPLF